MEKVHEIKDIIPCDIVYIPAEDYTYLFENIDTTKFYSEYFSIAIYYSLLIFKVLPEDVDKCFYIDSDIIVNTDLSALYETIPEDKVALSVVEFFRLVTPDAEVFQYEKEIFPKFWEEPIKYPYFNAGFFLLNMNMVRTLGVDKEIFDAVKKHPNLPYLDQDILNLVLGQNHREQMLYIPPKYNVFCSKHFKNIKFDKAFYNEEDITHAISYPLIFHFAGASKPWAIRDENMDHYDIWWYYCRMSPFHKLSEPLPMPTVQHVPEIQGATHNKIYLFGKLMVLRTKTKGSRTKYYLFGLLPILKRKVNENKTRYYLFGFLPLIKIKSGAGQDA